MKFAHIADCHIGGWREQKMREANEHAFTQTVEKCLAEKVDFVLISGDLFNTAFPAIDSLRMAVEKIKQFKDNNIPVYIIAGSHDSSASGKTIIDVLESAGLVTNVAQGVVENEKLKLKFITDKKTGTKITGLPGKRGGLEKEYYKQLSNEHLETAEGTKIFMFHSAIEELKQKEFAQIDAMSASLLPKNFDYYAGGHVHIVDKKDLEQRKNIVYPGPTFPNSFSEMEKLKCGSFCIIEDGKIKHEKIEIHSTITLQIDCQNKNPGEINIILQKQTSEINANNAIILLRLAGKMREGKTSEIDFNKTIETLQEKGAYFVLRNTAALTSPEFEEIKVTQGTTEDIEEKTINEHAGQYTLVNADTDKTIIKQLLQELSAEKNEAEKNADFEKRIINAADKIFTCQK